MDWTQADESGDYVFQIIDTTEKVCFKSVKDGAETVKEYTLDLTLESE